MHFMKGPCIEMAARLCFFFFKLVSCFLFCLIVVAVVLKFELSWPPEISYLFYRYLFFPRVHNIHFTKDF